MDDWFWDESRRWKPNDREMKLIFAQMSLHIVRLWDDRTEGINKVNIFLNNNSIKIDISLKRNKDILSKNLNKKRKKEYFDF